MHVGEAFLQHTKQSGFGIGGEPDQFFVYGYAQMNAAALFETFGIPEHRGSQAAFIEERRMQEIGEGANFLANFADRPREIRSKASLTSTFLVSTSLARRSRVMESTAIFWPVVSCRSRAMRRRSSSWSFKRRAESWRRESSLTRKASLVSINSVSSVATTQMV